MSGIGAFLRRMRAQQIQALERFGVDLPPFSIWDPEIPDARVRDPKKRGEFYSPQYGSMSRMYCINCGKPSPYAVSESMMKVLYKCPVCVSVQGHPAGAAMVPGTNLM